MWLSKWIELLDKKVVNNLLHLCMWLTASFAKFFRHSGQGMFFQMAQDCPHSLRCSTAACLGLERAKTWRCCEVFLLRQRPRARRQLIDGYTCTVLYLAFPHLFRWLFFTVDYVSSPTRTLSSLNERTQEVQLALQLVPSLISKMNSRFCNTCDFVRTVLWFWGMYLAWTFLCMQWIAYVCVCLCVLRTDQQSQFVKFVEVCRVSYDGTSAELYRQVGAMP